jgi:hypothetical protein
VRRLKVYIAGPLTAPTAFEKMKNTYFAVTAGLEVWKRGHDPYIPHLTTFVEPATKAGLGPQTWEHWLQWDLPWLRVCDAVLFLGPSPGADREVREARKLGLPVFTDVEDLPRVHEPREAVERPV